MDFPALPTTSVIPRFWHIINEGNRLIEVIGFFFLLGKDCTVPGRCFGYLNRRSVWHSPTTQVFTQIDLDQQGLLRIHESGTWVAEGRDIGVHGSEIFLQTEGGNRDVSQCAVE